MPKLKLTTNLEVPVIGTGLAYSYERVSHINQVDGDGLERQRTACSMFCDKHGLKEAGELRDKGLSAYHRVHQKKGMLRFFVEARKEGRKEGRQGPRSVNTGRRTLGPFFPQQHQPQRKGAA